MKENLQHLSTFSSRSADSWFNLTFFEEKEIQPKSLGESNFLQKTKYWPFWILEELLHLDKTRFLSETLYKLIMSNYIFVYGNQNIPYSRGTFKLINTIILY